MSVVPGPKDLLESAEALCRARGGRLTPQRRSVLAELLKAGRPLTAYELLDRLHPKDPAMKPASAYRSLEFLVDMGLVHRLESTRSFVGCEYPDHVHAGQFLICRQCGTVVEAEDKRVIRAAENLCQQHGFMPDRRGVELTGVCGACRATESGASART